MAPTKDCMVFDFLAEFCDVEGVPGVPGVLGIDDVGVEGYNCRFAPFFGENIFRFCDLTPENKLGTIERTRQLKTESLIEPHLVGLPLEQNSVGDKWGEDQNNLVRGDFFFIGRSGCPPTVGNPAWT